MIKYDVVIKNGTIIDPKRKKSTIANIGILNGKIREITREEMEGNAELDVSGKIVCPGIIDIHAHVEGDLDCARVLAAMELLQYTMVIVECLQKILRNSTISMIVF